MGHCDRPAAVGAHPRHRRFQGLVNPCRAPAARLPAILRTSPSTGTPAASLRSVLGEGGGLSEPRPTRSGQLPPQVLDLPLLTLVLASQAVDLALLPVVLPLAPRQLFPEPLYLVAQPSYPFVAGIVAGQPVLVDHTRLMPYLSQKYNPKKWILRTHPLNKDPLAKAADRPSVRELHLATARKNLVVRHVIIFGYGHGLQRAIIDESQHRTPERLVMAQH